MALKLPSAVLQAELQALLNYWATRGAWLAHLFVNDYQPAWSSVLGNFTEAAFTGYAPVALPAWGPIGWSAPDALTTSTGPCAFNNQGTAPVVLYGYYLTDGSGALMWAERDTAAPVTLAVGQSYVLTLRRAQRNQGD